MSQKFRVKTLSIKSQATGDSGLILENINNSTSATSGAANLGVDVNGKVVIAPGSSGITNVYTDDGEIDSDRIITTSSDGSKNITFKGGDKEVKITTEESIIDGSNIGFTGKSGITITLDGTNKGYIGKGEFGGSGIVSSWLVPEATVLHDNQFAAVTSPDHVFIGITSENPGGFLEIIADDTVPSSNTKLSGGLSYASKTVDLNQDGVFVGGLEETTDKQYAVMLDIADNKLSYQEVSSGGGIGTPVTVVSGTSFGGGAKGGFVQGYVTYTASTLNGLGDNYYYGDFTLFSDSSVTPSTTVLKGEGSSWDTSVSLSPPIAYIVPVYMQILPGNFGLFTSFTGAAPSLTYYPYT